MLSLLFALSLGTQTVWNHHLDAWNKRDVAAITADYADDATVVVNHQRYHGKREIAGLFRNLFTFFDRAETHVIDPADVIGKIVYLTWHARVDGVSYPVGTDTFVIENDQIQYQTITYKGVTP